MSDEMVLFDASSAMSLPAHLQGYNPNVGTALMAAIGIGGNRIGLKGSRFRIIVNGKEEMVVEQNSLNVIVVGAAPAVSRVFYDGVYSKVEGENKPPSCYSADGKVPANDVKQKQSSACDLCPQNVKGSKVAENGAKTKACSYFRRLVVMLQGDPEHRLFRLDVKAMSLFGESHEKLGRYSLNDYGKFLSTRNVDVGVLVTQLSMDTDESVPKVLFKALGYINEEEVQAVQTVIESKEVEKLVEINMQTVDISGEVAKDEEVPAEAPVQAKPAQQAPAAQQAPKPQQTAPKPVATPTPATGKPNLAKPATPAKAAPAPAVQVEDVPVPVQAATPVKQEAIEVESADDLTALLADLDI